MEGLRLAILIQIFEVEASVCEKCHILHIVGGGFNVGGKEGRN